MYFTQKNINIFATGLFRLFNKIMEEGENVPPAHTKAEGELEQLFKEYENKISEDQVKSSAEVLAKTNLLDLQIKLEQLSDYRKDRHHGALIDTLDILDLLQQNKLKDISKNIEVLREHWGNISLSATHSRVRKVKKLGYLDICGRPRLGTSIKIRKNSAKYS